MADECEGLDSWIEREVRAGRVEGVVDAVEERIKRTRDAADAPLLDALNWLANECEASMNLKGNTWSELHEALKTARALLKERGR